MPTRGIPERRLGMPDARGEKLRREKKTLSDNEVRYTSNGLLELFSGREIPVKDRAFPFPSVALHRNHGRQHIA